MSIVRRDQFVGSNNIAKPERLPEGAVVDAVNMDFTVGGKAELRTGFSKVRDCSNARAIYASGDDGILVIDSNSVFHIKDGIETALATISAGPVSAVSYNAKIYLNTLAESIVIDQGVTKWALSQPQFDVSLVAGTMPAGIYKVAVTELHDGIESGCIPATINVGAGQAISVTTYSAGNCRLYSSVANGQTLYHQGSATIQNKISVPVDDTARLETAMLSSLPFCNMLTSHNAMIVGARGRFLYHTRPMTPHLHNPESDYIQYAEDITIIAAVAGGIYVCADKTYFVSGLGSQEVNQRLVHEFGAITGTAVKLPSGAVTWFSKYGQVIAGPDGAVELVNRASYSPDTAKDGAAGLLEHNGNQMIVTTMRGEPAGSSLRSTDHWDIEVI